MNYINKNGQTIKSDRPMVDATGVAVMHHVTLRKGREALMYHAFREICNNHKSP